MQYTTLGATGLVVSRPSFGATTFGQGALVPGVVNDLDQAAADRMVGRPCAPQGFSLAFGLRMPMLAGSCLGPAAQSEGGLAR